MQNIDIILQPSKLWRNILLINYLCCGFILAKMPFSNWLKVSIGMALALYSLSILHKHILLLSRDSVLQIVKRSDGWLLKTATFSYEANLLGETTLSRWLAILHFQDVITQKKIICVVFHDSMSVIAFKRLIVQCSTLKLSKRI